MVAVIETKRGKSRAVRISPADHGKRMSLGDFDRAIAAEGHHYELNKGVIEVSDIPSIIHAVVLRTIRLAFSSFENDNPDVIHFSGGGGEAKVLIGAYGSERHPDWAVYISPPPTDDPQPWNEWVPEIVVEVVSESSRLRDYEEKPPEYLALGVKELWLVDLEKKVVIRKTRWRGLWKDNVLKGSQTISTTLLPGLSIPLKTIFATRKKKK